MNTCTLHTNFNIPPSLTLNKILFYSTYCVTNESWENSLEEIATLKSQSTIKKGSMIGVGISGIQLGLVALYGDHFDKIIFFDTNPYALSLLHDILMFLHKNKPSWGIFWQTYFKLSEIEISVLKNYFSMTFEEFSKLAEHNQIEYIRNKFLEKAIKEYDLKAKMAYELTSSRLLNQRKDTVFANAIHHHPFTNPLLFDAFLNNCYGKNVFLLHLDVMSDTFELPVEKHSASIVYIDGLMRFLNKKRKHGSFNEVAQRLNKTLGRYISPNSIILEEKETNFYLRAALHHKSILYAAKKCSTFEETKNTLGISSINPTGT